MNLMQFPAMSSLRWTHFTLYSLSDILSVKTNYEAFSNLRKIEKKIEKSSINPIIGLIERIRNKLYLFMFGCYTVCYLQFEWYCNLLIVASLL